MDTPNASRPTHDASFDLNALAWVQEELRKSLDTAHKALRRFLKEAETAQTSDVDDVDPSVLRTARLQVHQGVGALELVGLTAGATLLRAIESAVQRFVAKPRKLDAAAVDAIEHASFALQDYIARLLAGKPVPPVALFPQYAAVQALGGGERAHPADLWEHDWQWRDWPEPEGLEGAGESLAADGEALNRFESELLAWMRRGAPAHAQSLAVLCDGLARGASALQQRTLWRLGAAFFDGVARGVLPADVHAKRMGSQLLGQLRAHSRGQPEPAQRLAQELLFHCAQAGEAAQALPRLRAVREAHGLAEHAPVDYTATRLGRFDPAWIAQARKRVGALKDAWSAVAGGEMVRLPGLHEQFSLVGDSVKRLLPEGERLADALLAAGSRVVQTHTAPAPALAMEVATAVLYLEATLDDGELDHPEQAQRVQRLAQRIQQVGAGHEPEPLDGWMEELYRRVSDRQTMGSVVHELRANLSTAEKQIDQYFRDPAQTELLVPVPGPLKAMRGVFSVLGLGQASQTVLRMCEDIDHLAAGADAHEAASAGVFDRLATNLGALGFLTDMLGVQPQLAKTLFSFDAASGTLQSSVLGKRLAPVPVGPGEAAGLIEQAQSVAQAALEEQPLAELQLGLDALSQDARVAAEPALAASIEQAQVAMEQAGQAGAGPQTELLAREQIAQAMVDFVNTVSEPMGLDLLDAPSTRTGGLDAGAAASAPAPLMPVPAATVVDTGLEEDDEMRAVFIEEAREVIGNAREALAALAAEPGSVEQLTTVRRAFHTLKGSSRMVGLTEYGEAGWACEQLYNAWLASQQPASDDLRHFTGQALNVLAGWIDEIEAHAADHRQREPLCRAADTLRTEGRLLPIDGTGVPASANVAGMAEGAAFAPAPAAPADPAGPIAADDAQALPAGDLAKHDADAGWALPVVEDAVADAPSEPVPAGRDASETHHASEAAESHEAAQRVDALLAGVSLDLDTPPAPALPPTAPSGFADTQVEPAVDEPQAVPESAQAQDLGFTLDLSALDEPAAPAPMDALPGGDAFSAAAPLAGELRLEGEAGVQPEPAEASAASAGAPVATDDFTLDFDLPPEDGGEPMLPAAEVIEPAALDGLDVGGGLAAGQDEAPAASPPGTLLPADELALPDTAGGLQPPHDDGAPHLRVIEGGGSPSSAPAESGDAEQAVHYDAPLEAANDAAGDPAGEQVKVIGPLRIGIPLFNIYLNEADELSRRLATELAEWSLELDRPVGDAATALAHSLGGSSATVGFQDLSQLARQLEHVLARSTALGHGTPGDAQVFTETAEEIRRLLHQFAAGFLKSPSHALLERLTALEHDLANRLDAQEREQASTRPSRLDALEDLLPADGQEARLHPAAAGPTAETLEPPADAGEAWAEPAEQVEAIEPAPVPAAFDQAPDEALDPFTGASADAMAHDPAHPPAEPAESVETADGAAGPLTSPAPLAPALGSLGQAEFKPLTPRAEAGTAVSIRDDALPPQWAGDDDVDAVDAVDADLFPIFEEEAEELLPALSGQMRDWLRRPADPAGATACMRTLHTLKGGARLAGAMRLGELAHRMESAIESLLARGDVQAADVEALQSRADGLTEVFEALRSRDAQAYAEASAQAAYPADEPAPAPAAQDEPAPFAPADVPMQAPMQAPTPAYPDLADSAPSAGLAGADASASTEPAGSVASQPAEPVGAADAAQEIDWSRFAAASGTAAQATPRAAAGTAQGAVRVRAQLLDRLVNHAGEVSITRSRLATEVGQIKGSLGDLADNLDRLRQQLRDIELQAETQMSTRMEAARAAAQNFDPLEFDRYTRFQELTRMMAESVNDVATVQRSLQRTLDTAEDQLAAQARLTRDMQDDLLRTRMVEFEGLSDRLYRVVRQAAKETGKQVRLDLIGGNIEVDRGVLDRMTPAFEHLLRNCVTHGIEPADRRLAAGKEAAGLITVSLQQEGNEVSVEFRDDGAGLDLARIRDKAGRMGLLAADAQPTDAELANLIFTPGFSTAEQVTELAGRGIGMDVVRSEVNAMGGRIETASAPGQGTSFRLVLPLTTAVTQVVMLRCAAATVAVPTHLIEMVRRARPQEVQQAYEHGAYAFGDLTLPFFWLGALLQSSPRGTEAGRTLPVVIVRSAQQRIALHVDEVLGNQEVVVKNLGPQLSRLPGLAGMTLLASGAVSLIYNPVALATVYGEAARAYTARALQADAAPAAAAPLLADGEHAAAPPLPQEPEAPAVPLVLVVDDSLTVRRVTQRLLAREGYRVALAKDGLDALERLAEERPAVVLSDIEMPRMDGFDLVRNIRGDQRLSGLPVIMITSRIAQKHRDYASELGVNHYLGKPYSEEELLALIGRYTGAPAHGGAATAPAH
jgi:chemosensory pili system protein ChpA (sensor histidine kinase/response regulator)